MSALNEVLVYLGGNAVIVLALSSWLGKVWANRILEADRLTYQTALSKIQNEMEQANRRLQVYLDRAVHVHRLQFESEFCAMKTIWEKVITVRGVMVGLRPTIGTAPVDETSDELVERRAASFKRFSDALVELKAAIFNNGPFISEALYRELFDNLLLAAQAEELSISVHKPDEDNWYETGEKNLTRLMESVETSSQLIRDRLHSVAVLPE